MSILEAVNIKKVYKTRLGGDQVEALKDINFSIESGEFVAIMGESGSGKTTMLNIIGGLDGYTDGDLIINGISTKQYTDADWDAYRNHSIGFIFQSYNLIPHQTVLSNVEMALTLSGVSKKERKERAIEVLEKVGLSEHIHKRPNQMSGGQMQRVAIARALVNNPDILLADEPTGALDYNTSKEILKLIEDVNKKYGNTIIMVTHNDAIKNMADRVITMRDGMIRKNYVNEHKIPAVELDW